MRPAWLDDRITGALAGTYGGNALLLLRSTLANDCVHTVNRLFEAPNPRRGPERQELTIQMVIDQLLNDRGVKRIFKCDKFRRGTLGHYSIMENGVAREQTLAETFDRRVRRGRENVVAALECLNATAEAILTFVESPQYQSIRVYRVERLAHSVMEAHARRQLAGEPDLGERPIEEAIEIFERALNLASDFMLAAFGHNISISDQSLIWQGYAVEFWGKISGDTDSAEDIWGRKDAEMLQRVLHL